METSIKGRIAVQKSDDEKRLVFGWASVAQEESGNTLVDLAGDVIEPEVLEQAAYDFVRLYREGG